MSGHCTAVLAADSRSSAVTPLLLRSIVHQVLCSMRVRQCDGAGVGVLLASIALVVNDVTVDLLAVDEASAFHRLEVETSPLPEHRLRGVSCHSVPPRMSLTNSWPLLLIVRSLRCVPKIPGS
ncbi:hypothetical protein ERJ75_000480300 [Trypanosoma vivax]|nr:hypothetical protein ERJ75_000480300 [Trypanosoma vivax]